MSSEFWLISAPGEKTPMQTWEACRAKTEGQGLSMNYKFNLPELKVLVLVLFFLPFFSFFKILSVFVYNV